MSYVHYDIIGERNPIIDKAWSKFDLMSVYTSYCWLIIIFNSTGIHLSDILDNGHTILMSFIFFMHQTCLEENYIRFYLELDNLKICEDLLIFAYKNSLKQKFNVLYSVSIIITSNIVVLGHVIIKCYKIHVFPLYIYNVLWSFVMCK